METCHWLARRFYRFAKRGRGDGWIRNANASQGGQASLTVRRAPWPRSTRRKQSDPRPQPGIGEILGLGAEASAASRTDLRDAVLRGATCVVLSSLLVACGGPPVGDAGAANPVTPVLPEMVDSDAAVLPAAVNPDGAVVHEAQETDVAQAAGHDTDASAATEAPPPAQDKLPIIVNLAVGEVSATDGDAGDEALAAVTARVMERLQAAMPAEDLAEVRTFGFLPAIALSADGALMARLLAMPEVQSIELDRELQPLGGAAGELKFD